MKQDLDIRGYGENLPSKFQISLYLLLSLLSSVILRLSTNINNVESIIKAYKYIRTLEYTEQPDYNKLKYFIVKDLED